MEKSIVHYSELRNVVAVGELARIIPLDHPEPSLNGELCITGPVVRLVPVRNDVRPMFETDNSIYVPITVIKNPLRPNV